MSAHTKFITDDDESYECINIQVKFSGIDVATLNSSGKSLKLGGREFPSSRFGTWIFNDGHKQEDVRDILENGGIVVALIWGIMKTYPEVTAWVSDVNRCGFVLEMKKSQRKRVLNEIGCGKMAKQVEKALKNITATNLYKNIKVKLFKLMRNASPNKKNTERDEDKHDPIPEVIRMKKLEDAERVAIFMHDGNFSWAFMRLKEDLQNEKDEASRLQMLLRLAICSLHLGNKTEVLSSTDQLLRLMKAVDISAEQHDQYHADFMILHKMLLETGNCIRAIEMAFSFNEISKKISDTDQRIEKMFANLIHVVTSLHKLVSIQPGTFLMSQVLRYKEQVDKEIENVKKIKECNALIRSRNIYYIEFLMASLDAEMKKIVVERFGENSKEFNKVVCCWSDYPFVAGQLAQNPITAGYLADEEFLHTISEISRNPALLKEKISDIKIAQADEVLKSEFKHYKDNSQEPTNGTMDEDIGIAAGMFGVKAGSQSEKKKTRSIDKKKEAEAEKEKGNEAYKNKQFEKARRHYDKAISLDPTNALLHNNKAAVFIEEKKFSQAKAACLTAIRLTNESDRHGDRDVAKILARLARIEMLDGRPDLAIQLYDKSLRLHHDDKVEQQKQECIHAINAMRFMHSMRFPPFSSGFPFF